VRTIHSTPSTNIRLSRPVDPFWSGRPMISMGYKRFKQQNLARLSAVMRSVSRPPVSDGASSLALLLGADLHPATRIRITHIQRFRNKLFELSSGRFERLMSERLKHRVENSLLA
jgi:hypothetical protein